MQLPYSLKGYNMFVNGDNKYGLVADITKPKITRKTEDWEPGGGIGQFKITHGLDALEAEVTLKGYDAELVKSFGGGISGQLVRFENARQQDDLEDYIPHSCEGRGRWIEIDPGHDKQGESGEHKFKLALTYWKETFNGEVIVEIDIRQGKAVFGGKDMFAGLRQALGI